MFVALIMLNTKFIAMKKMMLSLVMLCFVLASQTTSAKANANFKGLPQNLKKGDWFTIEFSNTSEDYSHPVDSIDYTKPYNLQQLVLKCEVLDVAREKMKLQFSFERFFYLNKEGFYYDSYFDDDRMLYAGIFKIPVEINMSDGALEFGVSDTLSERYWFEVFSQDLGSASEIVCNFGGNQIKELLSSYLTSGLKVKEIKYLRLYSELNIDKYGYGRILNANFKVKSNTTIAISVIGTDDGDSIIVMPTPVGKDTLLFKGSQYLRGEILKGKVDFDIHLEQQKTFSLRYKDKEIVFVATPGEELHISFDSNDIKNTLSFSGDGNGDNTYLTSLGTELIFSPDERLESINTFDSLIVENTRDLNKRLDELKKHSTYMSTRFYKAQLKVIYYSAAIDLLHWHNLHKQKMYATDIEACNVLENIHPLYDYRFNVRYLDYYLNEYSNYRSALQPEAISAMQSFGTLFGSVDGFYTFSAKFRGYPKYFLLRNIIVPSLALSGLEKMSKEYDDFMMTCSYPRFRDEVRVVYDKLKKLEPGAPALDCAFFKNEGFDRKRDRYKIVKFINGGGELSEFQRHLYQASEHISNTEASDIYVVYTGDVSEDQLLTFQQKISLLTIRFIKMNTNDYSNDRGMYRSFLGLIILSPDNKIVWRTGTIWNVPLKIHQYIEKFCRPTTKADNSRLWLVVVVSMLGFSVLSWLVIKIRSRQIQKREEARRQVSELELRAIRSQMNPHFIFNALGSIQNLINHDNTKNANLYLSSFARLMRMVLSSSNKKLVSLSDELELLKHYLQLEQLRVDFKYDIIVEKTVDPETEEIPGMLVQPFVENAVIHGITPKGEGHIVVRFSKTDVTLTCEITDDGVGIQASKPTNGNGLAIKLSETRLKLLNAQLNTKLHLKVEHRLESEPHSGTKITLFIPVG